MQSLSLYVHAPWCIRKCPYCDFNSHASPASIPEEAYIGALLEDLQADVERFGRRPIHTVFIGGGTPSLFSSGAWHQFFSGLDNHVTRLEDAEITLEANPGSADMHHFRGYREAGINRLSLGIQSFNPAHLKALGRVHDDAEAHRAIGFARDAGFANVNLDVMYGLPGQTVKEGLKDLETALSHAPEHLSWYALTLEPNTRFYKNRPELPDEETLFRLESEGLNLLARHGYTRYEISAFCKPGKEARHNLNYWLFGDYLGIGAGAHGKFTDVDNTVWRTQKHRQPAAYLDRGRDFLSALERPDPETLAFEFMLNVSRLECPIRQSLFGNRTGLPFSLLEPGLSRAAELGLVLLTGDAWQVTERGRRFTNDLQALFLPEQGHFTAG